MSLLTAVDSGPLQGPPQTRPQQISREAGAEAVEEEVADRYEAGGLPGFVSFSRRLKRCRQVSLPCRLRVNNATQAVMVATGQQWLPVWPGLTSRKLCWTAARGRREEVRSQQTARLCELQLAAEEVQASKSAVRTASEQLYPSSDGGHRPAMAACMAQLNVVEAPLNVGKRLQGRGTKPADC